MNPEFVPKLFTTLKGYDRHQLWKDVAAGTVVGIVAVPLAIAFAIASGVTPERGLLTAIVAGFLISVLGGSRVQIGGPTGAFVVIVAGIVAHHGLDGLLVATLMAGVLLVALGFARLGSAVKFIPHAIVTGFTSGITPTGPKLAIPVMTPDACRRLKAPPAENHSSIGFGGSPNFTNDVFFIHSCEKPPKLLIIGPTYSTRSCSIRNLPRWRFSRRASDKNRTGAMTLREKP
jgi:hypothetical protein